MATSSFAVCVGCAAGGFLEVYFGLRALLLPVVLAWIAF